MNPVIDFVNETPISQLQGEYNLEAQWTLQLHKQKSQMPPCYSLGSEHNKNHPSNTLGLDTLVNVLITIHNDPASTSTSGPNLEESPLVHTLIEKAFKFLFLI